MDIIFTSPFQTGPAALPRADLMDKWGECEPKDALNQFQCLLCKREIETGDTIRVYKDKHKSSKTIVAGGLKRHVKSYHAHDDCFEHYKSRFI